ncbi:MAG TPA: site-2 protease family protein, partial [Cytophagaceae bacterium]
GKVGLSDWDYFLSGLHYSIPFLVILTVHELGHYITARIYKVIVTLPYFIPLYIPFMMNIGTAGAFIQMKSRMESKKMVFDIGIAGPLAGFVVALGVLIYGFTNLPPKEYIFQVHPEYAELGVDYEKKAFTYEFQKEQEYQRFLIAQKNDSITYQENKGSWFFEKMIDWGFIPDDWKKEFKPSEKYEVLATGKNLLFLFLEKVLVDDPSLIPNRFEMYHYPYLFAGYLALFFTALNLLPIGQLDGGHVVYGLFGQKNHRIISPAIFILFVYFAGIGIVGGLFKSSFEEILSYSFLYIGFLYLIFSKTFKSRKNVLMVAVLVFSLQFFTEMLFPDLLVFNGYLMFALLIGRLLGVYHPPVVLEEPLSTGRKILGWISLIIFALCFTPQIIYFETIQP